MHVDDEDRRNTIIEQRTEPQAGEAIPPRILARGLEPRADEEGAKSFVGKLSRVGRAVR